MNALDREIPPQVDNSRWARIAAGVAAGDQGAVEELYSSLSGLRGYFSRLIGPDYTWDAYQNLIIEVTGAIQKGSLRHPNRLPSFARTVAKRIAADFQRAQSRLVYTEHVDRMDESQNVEHHFSEQEHQQIAKRILMAMPFRDRQVLLRFYVQEDRPEVIQKAMGISPTQFRLVKYRAKQRFTDLCRKALSDAGFSGR